MLLQPVSELLYYNNIRDFLIDRNIRTLDAKAEEKDNPYAERLDDGEWLCFIE